MVLREKERRKRLEDEGFVVCWVASVVGDATEVEGAVNEAASDLSERFEAKTAARRRMGRTRRASGGVGRGGGRNQALRESMEELERRAVGRMLKCVGGPRPKTGRVAGRENWEKERKDRREREGSHGLTAERRDGRLVCSGAHSDCVRDAETPTALRPAWLHTTFITYFWSQPVR